MWTTLIIVGGLVLMTGLASGFDYLGKKRKRLDDETKNKVAELEQKIFALESGIELRDEKISQLESDVSFVHKLIEKK